MSVIACVDDADATAIPTGCATSGTVTVRYGSSVEAMRLEADFAWGHVSISM